MTAKCTRWTRKIANGGIFYEASCKVGSRTAYADIFMVDPTRWALNVQGDTIDEFYFRHTLGTLKAAEAEGTRRMRLYLSGRRAQARVRAVGARRR